MKDRILRSILILIAGLLLLNFFNVNGTNQFSLPLIENEVRAANPTFLQVGKTYKLGMITEGFVHPQIKLAAVDKEGWIQDVDGLWINLDHVLTIQEIK